MNREYPARYSLKPHEVRQVCRLGQKNEGLSRAEVRGLARGLGCSTKPILQSLSQAGIPILERREPVEEPAPVEEPEPVEEPAPVEEPEVERLRAENAELRRQRQELDREVARAREAVKRTAALRRETASDREEIETLRGEVRRLSSLLPSEEDLEELRLRRLRDKIDRQLRRQTRTG